MTFCAHKLYFYYYAIKGFLRKQNIHLPKNNIKFETEFFLTPTIQQVWQTLFQTTAQNKRTDFTYYSPPVQRFLLKTLDLLGFNFKNVLHLSNKRIFHKKESALEVGKKYYIHSQLKDIVHLNHSRIICTSQTEVFNENKHILSESIDYIFIKNLSRENLNVLKNGNQFSKTPLPQFQSLSPKGSFLSASLGEQHLLPITISKTLGRQYAKISGDLNPLHTSSLVAKICGFRSSFLHGSAIANLLYKIFSIDLHEELKSIECTFCRPLYLGQIATLKYEEEKFELYDHHNAIVTYGRRDKFS